jgi:Flp pilus assembly protein TadB
MDPKPHHPPESSNRESADDAQSNGRLPMQDPETRVANAQATTFEDEVDHARRTAARQLGLETLERVSDVLMPLAITLAAIGIVIATLVVHPWIFSLNLLLAPLGLWAYRRSRNRRNPGDLNGGDDRTEDDGEPPP